MVCPPASFSHCHSQLSHKPGSPILCPKGGDHWLVEFHCNCNDNDNDDDEELMISRPDISICSCIGMVFVQLFRGSREKGNGDEDTCDDASWGGGSPPQPDEKLYRPTSGYTPAPTHTMINRSILFYGTDWLVVFPSNGHLTETYVCTFYPFYLRRSI